MQTNLSAALCAIRSGGERSGLTAHFFFGVKLARFGVGLKRIHDNRALKRGFKGIDYFHPEDQDLSLGPGGNQYFEVLALGTSIVDSLQGG